MPPRQTKHRHVLNRQTTGIRHTSQRNDRNPLLVNLEAGVNYPPEHVCDKTKNLLRHDPQCKHQLTNWWRELCSRVCTDCIDLPACVRKRPKWLKRGGRKTRKNNRRKTKKNRKS